MKTYLPKVNEIERNWLLIDAKDQVLGRLATKIADILRGKNKPVFTPHLDCGDFVVVINADQVRLTGRKSENKTYQNYSGYMGGLKVQTAREIRDKNPCRMVEDAVWGMLPKGRLGREQFKKLKVYTGTDHPHTAQTPQQINP